MNKVLLLAMLCVASASCFELENICSSDTFKFEGLLVNAFYRVRLNMTFGSLNYYLLSDAVKCYYSEFKDKANYWEALELKYE